MSNTANAPVLVVGNGPAGLIAALTLLRNGVPVRIIEKKDKFHAGQRGCGVQPRSMELYNFLGIHEIAAEGEFLKPMCNYGPIGSQKPVTVALMVPRAENTPAKPFANGVVLGQHHCEEIFRSHIEKYGTFVELSTELVSFEQDAEGVTARIVKKENGKDVEETIRTPFLIGADGAKGVTRKQLGLEFGGVSRPSDHALFGDIYIKGLDFNFWHRWGDLKTKFITLRPTEFQDLWGVVLGGQVDYEEILTNKDALVRFIAETTGKEDLVVGEVKELHDFSPNIRMVDKFGEGRGFVVGDAAHVHSPTGGQGMNSSVQDSFNLAWKISLVYKGLAPLSLLESYTEERVPVIQEMLQLSTKLLNRAFAAKAAEHNSASLTTRRPKSLDQLGINYRWSGIVVDERRPYSADTASSALSPYGMGSEGDSGVQGGDRAPDAPELAVVNPNAGDGKPSTSIFSVLRPTQHTALLFVADLAEAEPILEGFSTWAKDTIQSVVVLPKGTDSASIDIASFEGTVLVDQQGHAHDAYGAVVDDGFPVFIVRPDGVIGAVVKGKEGVEKYYRGIFLGL